MVSKPLNFLYMNKSKKKSQKAKKPVVKSQKTGLEGKNVVSGVLSVHHRGFGFVQPNDGSEEVFIPKHSTKNAVDGDLVEVCVNSVRAKGKGPDGFVVSILERGRTHLAGAIVHFSSKGDSLAYVPLLGVDHRVVVKPSDEYCLRVGDRVIMKVVSWGDNRNKPTICQVSHYIGNIDDPSCDVEATTEEFALRNDFPSYVLEEVYSLGKKVTTKDFKGRRDLRELECVTIDPDTAKDFDDAISLKVDARGHYHLGVHIADVSYYVRPGSAIDEEAHQRCNSTYFPGYCIPMLPSALSEDLCSLKPNVNRLTVSVFMEFDDKGHVVDYDICRSVIKSDKRFTYRAARDILDGKKQSKYLLLLQNMVELCNLLKKQRYNRGSIEFALSEVNVVVDDYGDPIRLDRVEYDVTHQMIEEFMLKANEIVAQHLAKQNKGLTYRIHEHPSDFEDFVIAVRAFGFQINNSPSEEDIQALFKQVQGTPCEQYIAVKFIKSMQLASYSTDNVGHYGLALEHYCHFTSPIRRYIDLVVHRILLGEECELEHLDEMASLCSAQERVSARAENNIKQLKKMRYLKKVYDRSPKRSYTAVITNVRPFGLYFEVEELMLEGFIRISEIGWDYYVFKEAEQALEGEETRVVYRLGDTITVTLLNIDFLSMMAGWAIVASKNTKPRKRRRRK